MPRVLFHAARRRRDDAAPAHHRLCHARQWRQAHHADASSTGCRTATARPSIAPTSGLATAAPNVDCDGQAPPELPDDARADRRSAQRLSDRVDAGRRGAARHRPARSRRSAARSPARPAPPTISNDTWFIGFSPDLVGGVFVGFDQPQEPGQARDRRQRRRAGLQGIHGRGAEGPAGDAVPHSAGHRHGARRIRRPAQLPAAATATRSTKPFKPGTGAHGRRPARQRSGTGVATAPFTAPIAGDGRAADDRRDRPGAGRQEIAPCSGKPRPAERHRRIVLTAPSARRVPSRPATAVNELIMRAEIEAVADEIRVVGAAEEASLTGTRHAAPGRAERPGRGPDALGR